jgi:hypothetical protein
MLAVTPRSRLAGTTGLEPAASRSTTERSARLSYAPEVRGWDSNPRSRAHEAREDSHSSTAHRALCKQVWPAGVEPAIFCHPSTACCLCDRQGSNLRRLAFQASALPAELRSRELRDKPRLSVHLPARGKIDAAGGRLPGGPWFASSVSSDRRRNDVVHATRLPFDPGSPSTGCVHPERSTSYVEELWSPILALIRKLTG